MESLLLFHLQIVKREEKKKREKKETTGFKVCRVCTFISMPILFMPKAVSPSHKRANVPATHRAHTHTSNFAFIDNYDELWLFALSNVS